MATSPPNHPTTGWYVVYHTSGTVSGSRGGAPGTATAGYIIVEATSDTDAENIAQSRGYSPVSANGPFPTKAAATTAAKNANESNVKASGGAQPTISNPLADVDNFFHAIGEGNTWKRVGEFAVGGLLLFVALRAMFPGTVGAATSAIGGVAKKAPFLA